MLYNNKNFGVRDFIFSHHNNTAVSVKEAQSVLLKKSQLVNSIWD